MERETGLEPATSTLARLHSTTELLPLAGDISILALLPAICQFVQEVAATREHFPLEMGLFPTAYLNHKWFVYNILQSD